MSESPWTSPGTPINVLYLVYTWYIPCIDQHLRYRRYVPGILPYISCIYQLERVSRPVIHLLYTWYMPTSTSSLFKAYTWYIPSIYQVHLFQVVEVYTWHIPGIYSTYIILNLLQTAELHCQVIWDTILILIRFLNFNRVHLIAFPLSTLSPGGGAHTY